MGNQTSTATDTTDPWSDAPELSSSTSSSSSQPSSTSSSSLSSSVKPDTFVLEYREGKLTNSSSLSPSVVQQHNEILQKFRKLIGLFDTKKWKRLTAMDVQLFVLVYGKPFTVTEENGGKTVVTYPQMDVIGYSLVQSVPVTVPEGRCVVPSPGTAVVEYFLHDFEIFLNHRGRGYATVFLQWLLRTQNPTASSLLPYNVPPLPPHSPPIVAAVWGLHPNEDTLEFIRNKVLGQRGLAAWFVIHCTHSSVPPLSTIDNENNVTNDGIPSLFSSPTDLSTTNPPSSVTTNTFPFPWHGSIDTVTDAIERVQATMNKEASVNNWNIQNLLQEYTDYLRSPFISTSSSSSSFSSTENTVTVSTIGPHFPDEYASAVALLAINEVFNTADSDTETTKNNDSEEEEEEEEEEAQEQVEESRGKGVSRPETHRPSETNPVVKEGIVVSSIPPPASSPDTAVLPESSLLSKRKYDSLNEVVVTPDTLINGTSGTHQRTEEVDDDKRGRLE